MGNRVRILGDCWKNPFPGGQTNGFGGIVIFRVQPGSGEITRDLPMMWMEGGKIISISKLQGCK